jgi:hypothetical protein
MWESYYFDIDENTDIEKIKELNPDTCLFDILQGLTDPTQPLSTPRQSKEEDTDDQST